MLFWWTILKILKSNFNNLRSMQKEKLRNETIFDLFELDEWSFLDLQRERLERILWKGENSSRENVIIR